MPAKTKPAKSKESPRITRQPSLTPLKRILKSMGKVGSGDVIPLLQAIQEDYGYLPENVVEAASELTGIPASQLYGVATFYAQFYLEPHGKHTVRVCRGTACYVRGARRVLDAVRASLGVADGETTGDMLFSLETVACLGACAMSPVMMVDEAYYSKMNPRKVDLVIERYRREGQ